MLRDMRTDTSVPRCTSGRYVLAILNRAHPCFTVTGAENCPHDYLRVYDGRDERAPLVGVFCGMGRFPYSIIGTGNSLLVEFVTSPAGPLLHSGFHFNVGAWPGRNQTAATRLPGACSWRLSQAALRKAGDQEGVFLSVVHWYPPHTTCTYLIQGNPGHVVRLSFPR